MSLRFEWDEEKESENQKNHGVSCEEAVTVFNDTLSLTMRDERRAVGEFRYIDLGVSWWIASGEIQSGLSARASQRVENGGSMKKRNPKIKAAAQWEMFFPDARAVNAALGHLIAGLPKDTKRL